MACRLVQPPPRHRLAYFPSQIRMRYFFFFFQVKRYYKCVRSGARVLSSLLPLSRCSYPTTPTCSCTGGAALYIESCAT